MERQTNSSRIVLGSERADHEMDRALDLLETIKVEVEWSGTQPVCLPSWAMAPEAVAGVRLEKYCEDSQMIIVPPSFAEFAGAFRPLLEFRHMSGADGSDNVAHSPELSRQAGPIRDIVGRTFMMLEAHANDIIMRFLVWMTSSEGRYPTIRVKPKLATLRNVWTAVLATADFSALKKQAVSLGAANEAIKAFVQQHKNTESFQVRELSGFVEDAEAKQRPGESSCKHTRTQVATLDATNVEGLGKDTSRDHGFNTKMDIAVEKPTQMVSPAKAATTMQVYFKGGKNTIAIEMEEDATVCDVRKAIAKMANIPLAAGHLKFGRHRLQEGNSLQHYNIKSGSTIDLVCGGVGGMAPGADEVTPLQGARL